jgi:hypothetical protein
MKISKSMLNKIIMEAIDPDDPSNPENYEIKFSKDAKNYELIQFSSGETLMDYIHELKIDATDIDKFFKFIDEGLDKEEAIDTILIEKFNLSDDDIEKFAYLTTELGWGRMLAISKIVDGEEFEEFDSENDDSIEDNALSGEQKYDLESLIRYYDLSREEIKEVNNMLEQGMSLEDAIDVIGDRIDLKDLF